MATKKTTSKKTTTKKTPAKKSTTAKMPSGKKTPTKKPTRKPNSKRAATNQPDAKPQKARRKRSKLSGLDMAAIVLAEAGEPLRSKEIARRVIAKGWKTNGKTPYATLYSAMLREIADRGSDSRFAKTGRGEFEATDKAGS
ncbi:MAG: winged helix-turn-helix domain-containing protein [bacterium]|nr:winged helix-turn-helix domain-containing protein [bacterium]